MCYFGALYVTLYLCSKVFKMTSNMAEKKYIDTKGAAEYLNMSERYVQRLARKGNIPSYRPSGKILLFSIEELDKWIVSSIVKKGGNV